MIDVHVDYSMKKQTIKALDGISLTIEPGEFLAVVGPSGSGKSTLLQSLGGMLSPTKGVVQMDDNSLYDLSADHRAALRKKNVGFVFQTFNLLPYLTAKQNVQIPLMLNGEDPKKQDVQANELLDKVGLKDRENHKPSELSSGQQQRVALARMLANNPRIIFADEPTGSLDPETGSQVIGFLKELHSEGHTIVMVTHDPIAAEQASRCIRMVDGQIITTI
ncbi:MAG: ABC transporter ATP-binding protein [Desulfobacteraceae bacterium]|nr:ABC transporter ATP-binding protein [Desulfobacteraceae bacterium]